MTRERIDHGKLLDELEEAQSGLLELIDDIKATLERAPIGVRERALRGWVASLEVAAGADHDWLDRSDSLTDTMEELADLEAEEDEEEDPELIHQDGEEDDADGTRTDGEGKPLE